MCGGLVSLSPQRSNYAKPKESPSRSLPHRVDACTYADSISAGRRGNQSRERAGSALYRALEFALDISVGHLCMRARTRARARYTPRYRDTRVRAYRDTRADLHRVSGGIARSLVRHATIIIAVPVRFASRLGSCSSLARSTHRRKETK